MPYGTIKVDNITFTNGGSDSTITVSGIVEAISGNITATGTIQGATIIGTSTVSGATVTGNTGQFTTLTGGAAGFTTVTGVSGIFTSQISGATVTGSTASFTSGTFVSGIFTTQISGATITGTAGAFATLTGGVATLTSGVFALGTQALPSITFTGDTDTGIYSPGADQVAISTSGTGRLFVDASGNVGVGASGPVSTLNIRNDSLGSGGLAQSAITLTYSSTNYGQHFIDANGAYNIYANANGVAGGNLQLRADTDLIFYTASNERLRITSAGLVGIGTSSPAKLLEVNEGDIQIRNSSNASLSTLLNYGLTFRATNQIGQDRGTIAEIKPYLGGASDNDFGFQFRTQATTAGGVTTKMTLTPGGSVGIGTQSPSAPFDLYGASNALCFRIDGASGATDRAFRISNSANSLLWDINSQGGSGGNGVLTLSTNSTERARIDSSGTFRVKGAGTAGANDAFAVNGSAPANSAQIDSSGRLLVGTTIARTNNSEITTIDGNIALTNDDTYSTSLLRRIAYYSSTGSYGVQPIANIDFNTTGDAQSSISFTTRSSPGDFNERARIDSSGRLLVGTPSSLLSYSKLQVQGGAGTDPGGHLCLANENAAPSNATNIGSIRFTNNAGGIGAIVGCEADGAWTAGSNYRSRLVFSTTADGASSPTERMRIGSSGTARLFTSDYGLLLGNSQSAGTTYTALEIYAGSTSTTSLGTLTLQIYNNGNVQNTNNSYGALSDLKLKENIVDATSQWDDIKALQVRKYNFKEGQTHTQIGLVAQEVELVSPGLVSESPDRDDEGNDLGTVTKSVNYSVLYMKAVKALQEAMERIETLEAKVAALEAS